MTPGTTPELIEFGIGCFSFEAPGEDHLLMRNARGRYTIHHWVEAVADALKTLPSVDNVELEGFGTVRGDRPPTWRNFFETVVSDEARRADTGLHEGGELLPHPVQGVIQFDVSIPPRLQQDVLPLSQPFDGSRFEVAIHYGPEMPVAFVRSPPGPLGPSRSLAVVREFLHAEWVARLSEHPVKFVAMGPSPMWVDCSLVWGEESQEPFALATKEESPGYDQLEFKIRPSRKGRPLDDAYLIMKLELLDTLSAYYELVSRNAVLYSRRRYVERRLEELVLRHQTGGPASWLWRRFRGERATNGLLLELLAIEGEFSSLSDRATNLREELLERTEVSIFESSFMREARRAQLDFAERAKAVVAVLGERHSRETQLVAVLTSSVLGGLVGSALTALVQVIGA